MKNFLVIIMISLFIFSFGALNAKEKTHKKAVKESLSEKEDKKAHNALSSKKSRTLANKILSQLSTEEKNKLKQLMIDDPQAFKQELKSLAKKFKHKNAQEKQALKNLAAKYNAEQDPEKKQKMLDQLTSLVRKQYEEKMAQNWRRYKEAEKRLMDLKKQIQLREKNADQIIDKRVHQLIKEKGKRQIKISTDLQPNQEQPEEH